MASFPEPSSYAWNEFLRNTLATHATVFPDHWDGLITVDDECAAYYQSPPSGCGIGLATGAGATHGYDTQIMHQPAYSLFDLVQLAGLTSLQGGYRITPHLPMTTFNIRLPSLGLAQRPRLIRGYFRTGATTSVTMQVAPPPGVTASKAVAYVNGHRVPHSIAGGLVQFTLPLSAGRASDWAVTARR